MLVGDLCFGHLKGFKPSPAKVIEVKLTSYVVQWLESGKTSSLGKNQVKHINEATIQTFVTEKSLKNPLFKKGLRVLMSKLEKEPDKLNLIKNKLDKLNTGGKIDIQRDRVVAQSSRNKPAHEIQIREQVVRSEGDFEIFEDSSSQMENNSKTIQRQNQLNPSRVFQEIQNLPHHQEDEVNRMEEEDEVNRTEKEDEVNKSEKENEVNRTKHKGHQSADENDSENSFPVQKKTKAKKGPGGKNVNKTPKRRAINKTLRENEADCDKRFNEKITENDNGFICKDCEFATAWRLNARAHVETCEVNKKKRMRSCVTPCTECGEKFPTKALANVHFTTNHAHQTYRCSTCGNEFNRRQVYLDHLLIHNPEVVQNKNYSCDQCEYKAKDEWHMNRHKKSHEKKLVPKNYQCNKCPFKAKDQWHLDKHLKSRVHTSQNTNKEINQSNREIEAMDFETEIDTDSNLMDFAIESSPLDKNIKINEEHEAIEPSPLDKNIKVNEEHEAIEPSTLDNYLEIERECRNAEDSTTAGNEHVLSRLVTMAERIGGLNSKALKDVEGRIFENETDEVLDEVESYEESSICVTKYIKATENPNSKNQAVEVENIFEAFADSVFINNLHDSLFTGASITHGNDNKVNGIEIVNEQNSLEDELISENKALINEIIKEIIFDGIQILINEKKAFVNEIIKEVISDAIKKFFAKMFLCPHCEQKCRDNFNLKKHISSWHSVEVPCIRCGIIQKDKDTLVKHMKECSYQCPEPDCGKKFKKLSRLEGHKRAHESYSRRMS